MTERGILDWLAEGQAQGHNAALAEGERLGSSPLKVYVFSQYEEQQFVITFGIQEACRLFAESESLRDVHEMVSCKEMDRPRWNEMIEREFVIKLQVEGRDRLEVWNVTEYPLKVGQVYG